MTSTIMVGNLWPPLSLIHGQFVAGPLASQNIERLLVSKDSVSDIIETENVVVHSADVGHSLCPVLAQVGSKLVDTGKGSVGVRAVAGAVVRQILAQGGSDLVT